MSRAWAGIVYRVHRGFGSALSVLLLLWFASGAVMTFADFPSYSEAERLVDAPPLSSTQAIVVPPELQRSMQRELVRGARPRLVTLEGQATWLVSEAGVPRAFRSAPPFHVAPLDASRARAELERRLHKRVRALLRMEGVDQWSVGLSKAALPLYRAWLEGADGAQVYLSVRTGQLVQATTQSERTLAWVGAIPHWIYPTLLRRERAWWRDTVLVLSGLSLVLTSSGLLAGTALSRLRRRKGIRRPIADPILRWHHWLGLGFGALASSWLFSGALSLSPFDWPASSVPGPGEQAALYGVPPSAEAWPIRAALTQCQRELEVRELELASLGSSLYAVCLDAAGHSRIVELGDVPLVARRALTEAQVARLTRSLTLGSEPVRATTHHRYDAYHYPTHREPVRALPYLRLTLHDREDTTLYVDPARAQVVLRASRSTRLERWLYHGLHSFDLPGLYERRALWRTLMITLMAFGASLAALGLALTLQRRSRRRRRAAPTP